MLALTQSGPSVIVTGWVAFIIVFGAVLGVGLTVWKVLWPLLQTTVVLAEQLPFFRTAEARHDALAVKVDNHEDRITVLEQRH